MGKRERLRSALVDARQIVVDVFGPEHMDPFISLEVAKVLMTMKDQEQKAPHAATIKKMVQTFIYDWGVENTGSQFIAACGRPMFEDALIDLVARAGATNG